MNAPAAINQLNVSYDPEEDRVLLRFNDTARNEFRFFLTRLLVLKIWPVLVQLLTKNATKSSVAAPANQEAQKMMLEFAHQSATEQMDFKSQYDDQQIAATPLGEAPLLVHTIELTPRDGGFLLMNLKPKNGQGITLNLDANLLHAICKLLADRVNTIEWGVQLGFTEETATTPVAPRPPIPPTTPTSNLH
uniref:Uncharacterized protein n=1 Tax=Magnetococcus massalia (strain MO-1) TaxID=451514 RepID=A0A1S7LJ24_MAGMO|nr:Conserved protein of unknown function [Candidatus Magnetococcus massalia]